MAHFLLFHGKWPCYNKWGLFDIVSKEDIKDQIYGYGGIQAIRIVM